jgi:hypothetical protein
MKPKYNLEETVTVESTHLKGCIGVIKEIEKLYKRVDKNNNFESDGLVTLENTIKDCSLPYTFDGETLIIEFPEQDFGTFIQKAFTHTSKFYGYGYTVNFNKSLNNTVIPFDNYNVFFNEKTLIPYKDISVNHGVRNN